MKISILSPVRDEAAHLEEMIGSLFAQSFRDWEVLFVDDGSTDDTAAMIRRYAEGDGRITLVSEGLALGKAAAFNRAFAASTGDVVVLLAGDDRLPADSLEVRAHDLQGAGLTELVLASYKLRSFSEDPAFDGMVLPRGDAVSQSGGVLTMSRALANALFPIDESLPSEDIWLGYAAPTLATRLIRNPHVVLDYRIHDGNSNPRQAPFEVMTLRMAARHEAWRLLLESDLLPEGPGRTKLSALWSAELCRRAGDLRGLLRADGLGMAERLSLLAMAHPAPYAIRRRFYRLLSGRQGR